jgi:hypothetical protein
MSGESAKRAQARIKHFKKDFQMYSIKETIMRRDGLTADEAQDLLDEAIQAVEDGMDAEDACAEFFGLEPDYLWDLIG